MDRDLRQQFSKRWRFFTAVGAVLVLIVMIAYFFYGIQPVFDQKGGSFVVKKGESFRAIGGHLSQDGFIRSIAVFKFYSLISGKAPSFRPGIYTINSDMSVPEIVDILTRGGADDISITIPEGVTIKDIDSILSEAGIIKKGEIESLDPQDFSNDYPFLFGVKNFEGFFFPDTYRFFENSDPGKIAVRFLDVFKNKAWPILENEDDWHEKLIVASYLEREVPIFNDRRIVADIIEKRIFLKMLLQVDATVAYAKCNGRFLTCDNVLADKEDFSSIKSPYNTYQNKGFTPTPIANPGISAIRAAISPEDNPYLFYLSAKETGETIFSKTLEEHNKNKRKYL